MSRSNFICQYISDLIKQPIERADSSSYSSSLGAALTAGIGASVWTKKEELVRYRKNVKIFKPVDSNNNNKKFDSATPGDDDSYSKDITRWADAVSRFTKWYTV